MEAIEASIFLFGTSLAQTCLLVGAEAIAQNRACEQRRLSGPVMRQAQQKGPGLEQGAGALLLCAPQSALSAYQAVEAVSGLLLHRHCHVTVAVERHTYVRVAEALLYHLRVLPIRKHKCGRCVAEVMDADFG